ncbi:TonB-dependent receptor [Hymenobacter chitinivorans]|uniref:Iron complex outermembrane receptor protein n=1 Tax=Hymenobacter chitinivorans DSM 11115 TaxID=1121954 RepID=A0A2M9BSF5_9BACT|nr:TonB-dependent receptor [Hymenobacter chitinivorans]PJJ60867.1 iron complex outermembrane receptor protein [Hymenobacter chitinivorans DSM 11115]
MRRPLLLSILLLTLLLPATSWAQALGGLIVGKLVGADGAPLENISVSLKKTGTGVNTEANGSFKLKAEAGTQLLHISGLGYVTQETAVEVVAGKTITLPTITLQINQHELSEVKITEQRGLNQRPASVSKMPIAPLDLPQAAVTIDRQVLEQQQVLHLSDALVNVSGLYVTSTTGGVQEELGSRGFAYGSSNTFKNGVRFNNGIMPEASSLERMEVLKGSAAILYGNVAAGGVLNLVTKKPQFERGGSVGLRVGSFGLWKPIFDVYGAVGKSDKVAFRLNGTFEKANSFRDEVKSDRVYVNPSLLFELSPKTTLVLEGDYLRDNRTPDFGVGAINYEIQPSRSRFLNTPGAKNATQQTSTTATLTSRLSDKWQVRAIAGFQRYANEQFSSSRPAGSVFKPGKFYGNQLRSLQRSNTAENYYLAQFDVTGSFRTGFLGHTLLLGADADQYNTRLLAYTAQPYDSINILDRTKVVTQPRNAVRDYSQLPLVTRTLGNTRRAGFYVQDLLSLSEKVKVLAGLRWSYQETPSDVYTYTPPTAAVQTVTVRENRRFDSAFSPRVGLVYQPIKTTALFASYSNSFTPQANTVTDNQGNGLPPSVIDQVEVGIKNDLFKGALSANVTAYRIVNSNQAQVIQQYLNNDVRQPNPAYNSAWPSAQELAGEVTSKGVEVDIQSKPYLGWTFISGYSYNNTAYTKSNIYENGSRLRYNPAHTANLSVFYNFNTSFGENKMLRGLSAGFTTYYVGDKLAGRNTRTTVANDAFRLISIPDYVQFDASLGYSYDRFSLRVKLANILNELSYNLHDDNSVNPIAPRNFSATASYRL